MNNPLSAMARAYKTWRHGRGYGVHSPLAFDLLQNVLRLPRGYDWYDTPRVGALWPDAADARTAAMVFRLMCYRQPSAVCIVADDAQRRRRYVRALRLARPDATVTADARRARMVIYDTAAPGVMPAVDAITDAGHNGDGCDHPLGIMYVFTGLRMSRRRKAFESVAATFAGLVLDSTADMAICIRRRNLPAQRIAARF